VTRSNMTVPNLHVVLSTSGSYKDIVSPLVSSGARLSTLDRPGENNPERLKSKGAIIREMLSLRALGLRTAWKRRDSVLVVGWQAVPILAFIGIGVLPRPARLTILGCFVHSQAIRKAVNLLWRMFKFEGLRFITFSRAEQESMIRSVGLARDAVLFHLWRQELNGRVADDFLGEGDYVFAGGYSNRDYATLLRSVAHEKWPVVLVASTHNQIDRALYPAAEVLFDLDEAEFEQKLAGSHVAVLPLLSMGEACGQSVLIRILRNRKPMIASRHEAIVDYVGDDYPGFVPAGDVGALRQMIARTFADRNFYDQLVTRITLAHESLIARGSPADEIRDFIMGQDSLPDDGRVRQ